MAVLLPFAFGALWASVHLHSRRLGFAEVNARTSFVLAFGVAQLATVAIVELASLGNHLTHWSVVIGWTVVLVAALWSIASTAPGAVRTAISPQRNRARLLAIRSLGPDVAVGLTALVGILGALSVQAIRYRPSNADSMAYHLARVEHWVSNHSVAHYAAHYLAQIELAPLTEYDLLTAHLLSGGDHWDGFVQLGGVVVCVVGATELARRLGLGVRGQVFAGVVAATIPTLVLEATSTTTNVFAAAIGMVLLMAVTTPVAGGRWVLRAGALGATVGLAYLTKGTLAAMLGPGVAVLLVLAIRRAWRELGAAAARRALVRGALAAVGALVVVAGPFFARNLALFGAPSGAVTRSTIVGEANPRGMAGNVVRSAAAEFLIGDGTGIAYAVSSTMVDAFEQVYDLTGQRERDLTYTLDPDPSPFEAADFSVLTRFEDVGADPWHVVLTVVTLVVLGVGALRGRRLPFVLAVAAAIGFVAFSGAARWTIYGARYYIPLLVAWAPLVATAMSRVPRWLARLVALWLVVACMPQLLDNHTRSLIHTPPPGSSTLQGYFVPVNSSPEVKATADAYQRLTDAVAASGCDRIGIANLVVAEYPIWVGLRDAGWEGRMEHVSVRNQSRVLQDRDLEPCALIAQRDQRNYQDHYDGMVATDYGPVTLYLSAP